MLRAFSLAIGQLGDAVIVRVLIRSLLLTLLLFAALAGVAGRALAGTDPCAWLGDGSCPLGAATSGAGGVMLALVALHFFFPAVAIGVISGFSDEVVAAVERRHYPAEAARARRLGVTGSALLGLRSSVRVLLYNLVALPLYLLLLVTGVGTPILFVAVNGLAFGRDLGDMVALRHLARPERLAWLRATRGPRAVLGIIVTALFLVPVANLVVPVIAAAMAVHLFMETRDRSRGG